MKLLKVIRCVKSLWPTVIRVAKAIWSAAEITITVYDFFNHSKDTMVFMTEDQKEIIDQNEVVKVFDNDL